MSQAPATSPASSPYGQLEAPSPFSLLGMLLVRVIVPGWILAGAAFKTWEAAPRYLPATSVRGPASKLDIDLMWLLLAIVIVEFIIAAAMILFARVARPLAIMILLAFCAVLVIELSSGQKSCGCFGTKSPSPQSMLAIDGAMLLGAIFLRPWPLRLGPAGLRVALLGLIAVASAVFAWTRIEPGAAVNVPTGGDPTTVVAGPRNGVPNPNVQPTPQFWVSEDLPSLVGQPWTELELFDFMANLPSVPEEGTYYITFYGLNCEHCEDMFRTDLQIAELARMTTAILVPFGRDEMSADGAWERPETECELLELPLGADWIITTPLTLRVEDGLIAAIEEGDHNTSMEIDPEGVWTGGSGAASSPAASAVPAPSGDANGAASGSDADSGSSRASAPAPANVPPALGGANPNPLPLPQYWLSDADALAALSGTKWSDFELIRYMPMLPSVPATGVHYVTFYGRNCEHCEDMFRDDLTDPALGSKVTAVLVPFGKTERMAAGAWSVPDTECELLELPLGVDWIMTTPLTIRVEDGLITCAAEEDHRACMDLE
ncbi:MAG: MauE/DoxX family redox-associated membrane protein [Phycisphaerales bacterium]